MWIFSRQLHKYKLQLIVSNFALRPIEGVRRCPIKGGGCCCVSYLQVELLSAQGTQWRNPLELKQIPVIAIADHRGNARQQNFI